MRDKSKYTPMMQQYLTIKENYQDAFVFFRLGDFYELFFEDAQLVFALSVNFFQASLRNQRNMKQIR